VVAALAVVAVVAVQLRAQPAPTLDTQQKKVSYAIGLNLGKTLKAQEVAADYDSLTRGVKDGLAGTSLLDDKQIEETMATFQKEMQAKMQTKMTEEGQKNQDAGKAFLAETEKKPGVQKTASGLLYEIVKAGEGPKPAATDVVKVHYRGTLIDGKEFDSSYKRNQPAVFPVNKVITGWHEAIQLMPVGSKWKLYIPSDLAYGPQGAAGGAIPPNAVLLFEVELLSIEPPQ
jgi:FKBP-type peptidyl-prolyl cis-trans isomerase FkpA/FKBP-type peptidyl-prolyl cis-trans isomerase FklB